jgi:hypothetical protein
VFANKRCGDSQKKKFLFYCNIEKIIANLNKPKSTEKDPKIEEACNIYLNLKAQT